MMCGVFGFMAGYGKAKKETFDEVAANTATRGNHAWGVAWIDENDRLRHYKQDGDIRNSLPRAWGLVKKATTFIAHCRWSTHGHGNLNNHPHAIDGGWLIHNGVVKNYDALKAKYRMNLMTQCDTEVFCRMAEAAKGRLPDRMKQAIDFTSGNCVIAALWRHPTCLILARRGNPLSVGRDNNGLWFSSLGVGIQDAASVKHDTLLEYRYKAGLPMVYRKRHLDSSSNVVYARGAKFDPSGREIVQTYSGNSGLMSGTDFARRKSAEAEAAERHRGVPKLSTKVIRPNRVTDDEVSAEEPTNLAELEALEAKAAQDYYDYRSEIEEWTR